MSGNRARLFIAASLLLLPLAAGPLQGAENSPYPRAGNQSPVKTCYTALRQNDPLWGLEGVRETGGPFKQDSIQVTQLLTTDAATPTGGTKDETQSRISREHDTFADLDVTVSAASATAGPPDPETVTPTGFDMWSAAPVETPTPVSAEAREVLVRDAGGLAAALAAAGDGDVIRLAAGAYGTLKLAGYDQAVTIIAEDGAATFGGLDLENVTGLTLEGLTFQLSFEADMGTWVRRFDISASQDISVRDSRFLGDDAFGTDSPADGYGAGVGLRVRDSRGVTLDGLEVEGFWKGVMISRSSDVILRDSDLHDMRSDAMALSEVGNLLIENNHLHDRRGAPGSGDHGDMIQMMSRNAETISENVVLRGNLIDLGSGDRTQSIFLSNRAVANGAGEDMFYRNFLIEDNVVIGAAANALHVGAIDGLVIRNNTVLHAEPVSGQSSSVPRIGVMPESRNVIISDNVTTGLVGYRDQTDWTVEGNWILQNKDPSAPDHYSQHFVAPYGQLGGHVEKLWVKADSPIYESGAGAEQMRLDQHGSVFTPLIQNTVEDNQAAFVFDAGASVLPGEHEDAQYLWDFGDGTTATGLAVDHVYAGPGRYTVSLTVRLPDGETATTTTEAGVVGADLVGLLPQDGTLAAFGYGDIRVIGEESGAVVSLNASGLESDGNGLDLEALDGPIRIPRETFLPLFEQEGFEIALQLSLNGADSPQGEILRLHGAMRIEVDSAGEIVANANTAGGDTVKLASSGAGLQDGAVHDVQFGLTDGRLQLHVDGILQDSVAFDGMLADGGTRDMVLGGAFGRDAFPGTLQGFVLRSDPGSFVYRDAASDLPMDTGAPVTDIVGSEADDILRAGPEDTLLEGRGGNDQLREGSGDDVMAGGAGADRFIFDLRQDDGAERDRITDLDFASGDWIHVLTAQPGHFEPLRGGGSGLHVSGDGSSLQIRSLDGLERVVAFAPESAAAELSLARAIEGGHGSPKMQSMTADSTAEQEKAAYELTFAALSGDTLLISLDESATLIL